MATISEHAAKASLAELIEGVRRRSPRALARAVTLTERGGSERRELIRLLHPHTGRARLVGITGPPGAGKSTLVEGLARRLRRRGETVGVLAVDPSSPYTGGALLGDRIRMQSLATDPGVFIRSMATRGSLGGLAPATHDAAAVLDAAGFDWLLLETVGVGQDEVDVVRSADTVVVVTVPGLGDSVQAIKAGLMEIADVFVLNKADREGAEEARRHLEQMLGLGGEAEAAWRPPVLPTVATRDEGIEEVLAAVEDHREHLAATGSLVERRRDRLRLRAERLLVERLLSAAAADLERELERAHQAGDDPYEVAEKVFEAVLQRGSSNGSAVS